MYFLLWRHKFVDLPAKMLVCTVGSLDRLGTPPWHAGVQRAPALMLVGPSAWNAWGTRPGGARRGASPLPKALFSQPWSGLSSSPTGIVWLCVVPHHYGYTNPELWSIAVKQRGHGLALCLVCWFSLRNIFFPSRNICLEMWSGGVHLNI